MIKRLCPEGVKKVKLNSLCASISTGLNPRTNFKLNEDGAMLNYVTVKEIATNKIVFSNSTDKISDKAKAIINKRSRLEKGDILFSGIGTIGKVVYVDIETDNWDCSESVFLLKPNELVYGKFLSYTLISRAVISQYESCAAGAIMKGVRKATLENLDIPLPPLPIQQEIVRILDSFTSMITNLETELASRQKQYEHYRNKLLTFDKNDESAEWKTLGEIMTISRGASPRPIKNYITTDEQGINWIKIGDVAPNAKYITKSKEKITTEGAKHSRYLRKGDFILSNSMSFGRPYILSIDGCIHDGWISMSGFGDFVDSNYLYQILNSYIVQSYWKSKANNGGAMTNLNSEIVSNTIIPIPIFQRQQEIVSILDTFESLISNIKQELDARKKQYEYYREQLLTFRPSPALP